MIYQTFDKNIFQTFACKFETGLYICCLIETKMKAHTSLPWSIRPGVPEKTLAGRYSLVILHEINGPLTRFVCLVFGNTPEECKANAKLIVDSVNQKTA